MRPRLIWPMRMRPTKLLLTRPRLIWPMRMWPTKSLRPTISPSQNTVRGVNCSLVFEVATINWAEWFGAASAPLTANICRGLMQVLMVSLSLLEWGLIVSLWLEAQFPISSDLLLWQEPTSWEGTQFPTLSDFYRGRSPQVEQKHSFQLALIFYCGRSPQGYLYFWSPFSIATSQPTHYSRQMQQPTWMWQKTCLSWFDLLSKMQMAHSLLCWSPFGVASM